MLKHLTIAAAALCAIAIAAPAGASEIHVKTAGKTVAQINAEVAIAASTVCKRDTSDYRMPTVTFKACYRESLQDAQGQVQQLAQTEGRKLAQR